MRSNFALSIAWYDLFRLANHNYHRPYVLVPLVTQGKYDEAELKYKRFLAIDAEADGRDRSNTATNLTKLAALVEKMVTTAFFRRTNVCVLSVCSPSFADQLLLFILRWTIVNETYGIHENLYIVPFLLKIFGPIYYGPP